MNLRSLGILATAAVATGVLSACSSSDSSDDGPVTLTLVEYQESRVKVARELIPGFEKAMAEQGKEVEVELVSDVLTDDQFRTKITQQYNAGTAPDVADFGAPLVPGFAGAGYLLELDPYLAEWADWGSFYPEIKDQIVQPDGKTYSIPHEASVQSLFYRKDVLEELGVSTEQPQTWDELIERLEQVTAKTGHPSIVLPAGTAWGGGTFAEGFLNVMMGTGDTFYDADSGTWVLESDGLTETFQVYSDLTEAGLLPVEALLNPNPWQPTKYEAFPAGDLPVAAQGSWGWRYDWGPDGAAPIEGLTDKVATWDYPAISSGDEPYSTSGVGFSYAVSQSTEHPEEAVALAQYLSSGKALAKQLVTIGAASPRSDLGDVEPYASEPTLLDAESRLASSKSFPNRPGQDQVAQAVAEATESILTGDADGEAAAAEFAENAADLLGPSMVHD